MCVAATEIAKPDFGAIAFRELRRSDTISVAVIDGPYDAATLSGVLARTPVGLADRHCAAQPRSACAHGTFVIGLLGARRDAMLPGLCPDCQLIHLPLFAEGDAVSADVNALASAIAQAVAAGASLINLSLAILGDQDHVDSRLAAALDFAATNGAIVMAAAGNQGRLASGQLLAHPAVIPVVAVDAAQRLLPDSNFGPSLSRRGVAALGRMPGYAAGGGTMVMSGTSVAAAMATGILAQAWSEHPDIAAATWRAAIANLGPRAGPKPPVLDRDHLLAALARTMREEAGAAGTYTRLQGATTMTIEQPAPNTARPFPGTPPIVRPAGCGCGAPEGACTCGDHATLSGFVYAIGTIEADYPNIAIEREMQTLAASFGLATKPGQGALRGLTEDPQWQHAVLSRNPRATRYLARQLRWRLTIEDFPVYLLQPTDTVLFDDLIEALVAPPRAAPNVPRVVPAASRARKTSRTAAGRERPATEETSEQTNFGAPDDLDVVVGVVGPRTPEGTIVAVDQIFQIDPRRGPARPEYFSQIADNHGVTDEDRACNFLQARYRPRLRQLPDLDPDYEFVGLRMTPSRLGAGQGRVMRAIYTFRTKEAGTKEFFVRVDVTHEFPMIVSPWAPYLERGGRL